MTTTSCRGVPWNAPTHGTQARPYRICLIEGDGIGHEVVPAGRRLLEATGLSFEFIQAEAGWETFQRRGTALPEETVAAATEADATLFGAVSSPLQPVAGYKSPIVALRRQLDLSANLRPVLSQPVPSSRSGIDLLIVRENSEGLYSGRERSDGNEAVTERVITRRGSERIVRLAFRLAQERSLARRGQAIGEGEIYRRDRREHRERQDKNGSASAFSASSAVSLVPSNGLPRGREALVTIVHKANVLRATCGLFREVAFQVAKEFPDVRAEEMLVDTCAMRLITEPERFDVLVTTNLFGDILSDEAAALVGGLGLAPSGNVGDRQAPDLGRGQAIFEPVHGSAPDIAGKGIANPMATFLAVAMMLDHLGEGEMAGQVRAAVDKVLREGPRTPDLGGSNGTGEVTEAVIAGLAS